MYQEEYMQKALSLALEAFDAGEVPVGCVVVYKGQIVGEGRNRREEGDATAHAEVLAIRQACRALKTWRLEMCELYVTLEPCPMCAGAIWNARVPKVWFGAYDEKAGACSSVLDLYSYPINYKPQVSGGHLEKEAAAILRRFFLNKR